MFDVHLVNTSITNLPSCTSYQVLPVACSLQSHDLDLRIFVELEICNMCGLSDFVSVGIGFADADFALNNTAALPSTIYILIIYIKSLELVAYKQLKLAFRDQP